jgi:hypothetical protein
MSIRKWVLKIHLYGGLLCFWYLIIFAVSSLQFQHKFEFMNAGNGAKTNLEKTVTVIFIFSSTGIPIFTVWYLLAVC